MERHLSDWSDSGKYFKYMLYSIYIQYHFRLGMMKNIAATFGEILYARPWTL